jgi:Xaa-Pro aminopeptidase
MRRRQAKLLDKVRDLGLDGLLVTNLPNMRYLCGYSGDNGILLLTRYGGCFYTDFRYQEQVREEVKGTRSIIRQRDLIADFPVEQLKGIRKLGFEKSYLSYGSFQLVRKQLKGVKLIPCDDMTIEFRAIKEPEELELIARAAAITDQVLKEVLPMVKPGAVEKDLAAEIDFRFSRYGGLAFETIVASGPRGALPHAQPTNKKLKAGEAVVFDMGAKFQGYCSDMTRTVFVGKADRKGREIYEIVLEAQLKALGGVRAGNTGAAVDALAREHIKGKGYGPQFGHSLGHGVGLVVHEQPVLHSRNAKPLPANSVVTVEPGIYLPDWGGVRIEDMVVVTKSGCQILSQTTKRLIEC